MIAELELLECRRCGADFEAEVKCGPRRELCDPCRPLAKLERDHPLLPCRDCGGPKARTGAPSHLCDSCRVRAEARRREYLRAYNADYLPRYQADPENREAQAARERRWREQNRDRYRATQRRIELNRRARKHANFVEEVDPAIVLSDHAGLCGICGSPVDPADFHVDHIVPLAKGGEHSYANTQAAHPACNLRKGARI